MLDVVLPFILTSLLHSSDSEQALSTVKMLNARGTHTHTHIT